MFKNTTWIFKSMRVIGFNFKKMNIEKFKENPGNLKFNNKIDISSIEPLKSDFLKIKDDLLKIDYIYSVSYEPEIAKLELNGEILISVEPKMAKEILKDWKDKQTSEEFRVFLFNVILRKSNIKALQMEDDLGLPPHIPMPSLNKGNFNKEKKE